MGRVLLALAAFCLSAGCSAEGDTQPTTLNTGNRTAASLDGKASVSLPPGVLPESTPITIAVTSAAPGNLGNAYLVEPASAYLSSNALISIKYEEADIPNGINETDLRLATLVNNTWQEISDATVDITADLVTGITTRFGVFGIIAVLSLPIESVKVSSGGWHTCATTADERVKCWGRNVFGQLGNGTTTDATLPVEVLDLTDVRAIGSGDTHTVALRSDGTVWAWGSNLRGQLGDGTTSDRSRPVPVIGLKDIVAIAGGGSGENAHTLALDKGGTIWAWGDNYYGQLGDGTIFDRHTAVQVIGLSAVKIIDAGARHSVAVTADGRVWTWGRNLRGQLGNGTTSDRYIPVRIDGVTDVVAISAGSVGTLAVKSDGTAWSWGDYYEGLDPIFKNGTLGPTQIIDLANIQRVAAGVFHYLAQASDGTIWGWGSNSMGELGDGTTIQRDTPVMVQGIDDAVGVSIGYQYSTALRGNGTIWAWGANEVGQLGNGTTSASSPPGQVSD